MAGVALKLGYNTNGLEGQSPAEMIDALAEIGYRSIAITLDQDVLNPFREGVAKEARRIRRQLECLNMSCVVETGARHLLDPVHKHEPTLVSADATGRTRRLDFLKRAVDVAALLGAQTVSLWSGRKPPKLPEGEANRHLVEACKTLCEHALAKSVTLAFEPEPGMFIETTAQFDRLRSQVDDPFFSLTLDVGHLHCLGDGDPPARIRQYASILANVHIEDMRRGAHEHLMFGEGEMQFEPIISALREVRYTGGIHVELSRHSHDGLRAARTAHRFLSRIITEEESWRSTI